MSHAPLMLGISGLRGLIGQSLTPTVAANYGAAVGQWFVNTSTDHPSPLIVVGRDSRPSGQMIESAVAAGLVSVGCRVVLLGIATTPGVAVMVEHLRAHGGLVITASHNPIIWNGIKALRSDGCAPPPNQAQEIVRRFKEGDVSFVPVEKLQPIQQNDQAGRIHVDRILKHIDIQAIRKRKLKVVLDSVHGAGGPSTAMLMQELGVELVHLYGQPTGLFPHTPEPTEQNLTGLCQAVQEHRADLGLAQDPDADRLALVDETGKYIGEEYTLALSALHQLQSLGAGARGCTLAANLSTSRMIDDIAAEHGATVIRTPVGEANVAQAMRTHRGLIGGEGNGGIIWPKVIHVRDSLAGAALMLEMLAHSGQSLSQQAGRIPRYAIVKDKVDLKPGMLDGLASILKERFASQKIDLQDGVRIDWPDRWVHVRPSNTEPIVRLIAEASDISSAKSLIAEVRLALGLA